MTEAPLELDGLSRRFGSVTALDGLTFSVPPGQVFYGRSILRTGTPVRLREVLARGGSR